MSEDEKADRQAQRDQSQAADCLLKMPAEPSATKELFEELDRAVSEAKEASFGTSEQRKRMTEIYGILAETTGFIQKLRKMSEAKRAAVIRQVQHLVNVLGLDAQLDLFEAGAQVEEDTGSVFDKTTSGKKQKGERGDDPAKARKRAAPKATRPRGDTGALGPNEALAKFRETEHLAPKAGADPADEATDEPAHEAGEVDEDEAAFERGERDPVRVPSPPSGLGAGGDAPGSYVIN